MTNKTKRIEEIIRESCLNNDAIDGMAHHNKDDQKQLNDLHVGYLIRELSKEYIHKDRLREELTSDTFPESILEAIKTLIEEIDEKA